MDHRVEFWDGTRKVAILRYRWVSPDVVRVLTMISRSKRASRFGKWLVWNLPWKTLLYHRRATKVWHQWNRRDYAPIRWHLMS